MNKKMYKLFLTLKGNKTISAAMCRYQKGIVTKQDNIHQAYMRLFSNSLNETQSERIARHISWEEELKKVQEREKSINL